MGNGTTNDNKTNRINNCTIQLNNVYLMLILINRYCTKRLINDIYDVWWWMEYVQRCVFCTGSSQFTRQVLLFYIIIDIGFTCNHPDVCVYIYIYYFQTNIDDVQMIIQIVTVQFSLSLFLFQHVWFKNYPTLNLYNYFEFLYSDGSFHIHSFIHFCCHTNSFN